MFITAEQRFLAVQTTHLCPLPKSVDLKKKRTTQANLPLSKGTRPSPASGALSPMLDLPSTAVALLSVVFTGSLLSLYNLFFFSLL